MKPIKQRDFSDCGVACLAAVASHYDMRLSVAQIRQLTGTDQSGTTIFGLVQASKNLGFIAKAVKAHVDELSDVAFPAIAHVILRRTHLHYLVVLKIKKNRVTVMDPATGRFSKYSIQQFQQIWTGVLVLMAPGNSFQPCDQRHSRFAWYLQLLKPHQSALVQALIGAVLITLLALTGSFYIQKVVDSVIVESNVQLLNLLSISMLVVLAFSVVLNIGQSLLLTKSGQNIDLTLILSYYRHLFTLPQAFFDGMRIGEMVSRINDAVKIRAFLNQQGTNFIISAFTLVLAVVAMFIFSWKLALLSLVFLGLYSILFRVAVLRNRLFSRRIMEQSADFDAQIVESLEMASTLRRFDRQWVAEMKTEGLLVRLLKSTYSSGLFGISVNSLGSILVQGFTIALLWIGANSVIETQMSPGQLISCFALTGYLTGPANNLLSIIVSALEVQVAADRLFEILELDSEKNSGTIDLASKGVPEIRLENVSFGYPGRLPILRNVDACFLPWEITLLRGASGCGKSSILALLQRFYPPAEGRIFFGQYEIRYLSSSSLRTQIGVVPQKIDLMSGTVIENITLGEFEPDMEKILAICDRLSLLDFIQSLPEGFETRLTENGRNLSGGQRQRLAIARALYVNAPIYLFDEPTAALDEISENRFLHILQELRDLGKLVILVSHDSRLVSFADRVYTVSNGTIEPESTIGTRYLKRESFTLLPPGLA
jgi:ATP-binding cassette, subfamily C, bacteriocin exporter